MRWDKARQPGATQTRFPDAAAQWKGRARHKPTRQPKQPATPGYLKYSNPQDRAFVSFLLNQGLPAEVIAARTGMPARLVRLIKRPPGD